MHKFTYCFRRSSSSSIISAALPTKLKMSSSSSSVYSRHKSIVDSDRGRNKSFICFFEAVKGTITTLLRSFGSFSRATYPAFSSRSTSAVTEPVLRPVFSPTLRPSSALLHLKCQLISNRWETDRELERLPDETEPFLCPVFEKAEQQSFPTHFWNFLLTTDSPPYKIEFILIIEIFNNQTIIMISELT